ncbi:MAG: MotB family protein [Oricola sp.]
MNTPEHVQEIIIIKRNSEGDHGHHGGAWKIAFADFMTAMMALFLVLWLINAADQETKKSVASYFNPVKLVDRERSVKGVHDIEGVQDEETPTPNGKFPEATTPTDTPEQQISDVQFFSDPFASLEVIASEVKSDAHQLEAGGGRNGNEAVNDAAGGAAFMDPFTPNFWNEEVRNSNNSGQLTGRYETEGQGEPSKDQMASSPGFGNGNGVETPAAIAAEEDQDTVGNAATTQAKQGDGTEGAMEVAASGGQAQPLSEQAAAQDAPEGTTAALPPPGATADQTDQAVVEMAAAVAAKMEHAAAVEDAAAKLRDQITEQLKQTLGGESELVGELSVTPSGDEILISLTDAFDISMYEVGSAVPSPDLVVALERIGGVLAEQQGGVRIRGHTDARPFKSRDYDNWRLSAARAQSAYYMLLRGGLEETRVREIAGFADRKLLDAENPLSHKNRRIEVLVEVPQG